MTPPHPFRIIPCGEWNAQPARGQIRDGGVFEKAIFHHTAGHHVELPPYEPTETYEEALNYARIVQVSHFRRGWLDTGQNFMVCRSGHVLEGRHRSLELLTRGHMPISAHCPGQNANPGEGRGVGVEIEHVGDEDMTPTQYAAAVWLFAKILSTNNLKPARIFGHKDFINTECPANLYAELPEFRREVADALKPKPAPYKTPPWFFSWAEWWLEGADPTTRPAGVPARINRRHFRKLDRLGELYLDKSGQQQELVVDERTGLVLPKGEIT